MSADVPTGQSLTPFYAGWDRYNRLLVEAVAPLTPDHLALRVAPNLRTVAQLAAHIIAARAWLFHGVLREGDATIEDYCAWNKESHPALSAAHLEMGLETTCA